MIMGWSRYSRRLYLNLLDDIGMKLNEKMMFPLFFNYWQRVAIFYKKVGTLVLSKMNAVSWKIGVPNEMWFNLRKIAPIWSKLIFLSIVWRIVELALDMFFLSKFQWTEEDEIGGGQERTNLWVGIENFFSLEWMWFSNA